jgi:hypothetical protein
LTVIFNVHGVRLAVDVRDAGVLAAIDRRLCEFTSADTARPDIQLTLADLADELEPPPEPARPVYDSASGAVLYADATDQLFIGAGPGVRVVVDAGAGRIRAAVRGDLEPYRWLLSHPLLTLPLIELLKRRGRYSLHAAGVAVDGRALLLPGASGSGKSTLALALLQAGFDVLGDDLLFLQPTPDGPRVLAFRDEIDLTEHTARLLPGLEWLLDQPRPPGWPKWFVRPEAVRQPTSATLAARPAALVFPAVRGSAESTLVPLAPEEALVELAPNVLLTEAQSSAAHFAALADLARTCPAYRLDAGRDVQATVRLLGDVLGGIARLHGLGYPGEP